MTGYHPEKIPFYRQKRTRHIVDRLPSRDDPVLSTVRGRGTETSDR